MKKLLSVAMLLVSFIGISHADPGILANFGSVNVFIPFTEISAVYQYDVVAKRSLIGGETPLLGWKKLQFTGGAVTSVDGEGSPFLGVHLVLSNPAANYVPLAGIQPGVFAGRDFRNNAWIAGFKASINIFQ